MTSIEIFGFWSMDDEKLTAVGVTSSIGHGDGSLDMSELGREFVVKFLAVDTLATHPGSGWITSLDHKITDNAVENHSVVVPLASKSDEISTSSRCLCDEEFDCNSSEVRGNGSNSIACFWYIELRHNIYE